MSIKKAVITAAGYGTRMLPATKAMPKEMLPIFDKPAIQYIVEECVAAGIRDILIILSRGKHIVEDHFDYMPDLERQLRESGKIEAADIIKNIADMANITYVRQKEQLGLGHAVLCAKSFVGDSPFAVLYGDDVIINNTSPAIGQLIDAYDKYNKNVVGIRKVSPEDISKYSSVKLSSIDERQYEITDMIEKPSKYEVMSYYSIMGRCILTPEIFDILENLEPGRNGELQLTDAMKKLAVSNKMTGVEFEGVRYDMGDKLNALQASVEIALSRSEFAADLTDYIIQLADGLR